MASKPSVNVYFSPDGGASEAVVKSINGACHEVLVLARQLTSFPILQALLEAKKRGLRVRVTLDKGEEGNASSYLGQLFNAGIPLAIDAEHVTMGDYAIVLDGKTVLSGSFPYTNGDSFRASTLLVLSGNERLSWAFRANYFRHEGHARPPFAEGRHAA